MQRASACKVYVLCADQQRCQRERERGRRWRPRILSRDSRRSDAWTSARRGDTAARPLCIVCFDSHSGPRDSHCYLSLASPIALGGAVRHDPRAATLSPPLLLLSHSDCLIYHCLCLPTLCYPHPPFPPYTILTGLQLSIYTRDSASRTLSASVDPAALMLLASATIQSRGSNNVKHSHRETSDTPARTWFSPSR